MTGISKAIHILDIYQHFGNGEVLSKRQLCEIYSLNPKSVQRYIADINRFMEITGGGVIRYNAGLKAYELTGRQRAGLTDADIFALLKILFDVRAFPEGEMKHLYDSLTGLCSSSEAADIVRRSTENEEAHYVQPVHGTAIIRLLWTINSSIMENRVAHLTYALDGNSLCEQDVQPMGVLFSGSYFYLIANTCELDKPTETAFRVDRIRGFAPTGKRFAVPDKYRFQPGEKRKRTPVAYYGKLITLCFRYWGPSLETVLDRLPTASCTEEADGRYLIKAEVYDCGIVMWLLGQREFLEVLRPEALRREMRETIARMGQNYSDGP